MVYYQPKADALRRRVIGAEALVRWQHPEYGMLPPDDFIAIAEQSGLIGELTHFVDAGLHAMPRVAREGLGPQRRGEPVGGRVHRLRPSRGNRRHAALVGLDPKYLVIEITETASWTGRTRAAIAGAAPRRTDLDRRLRYRLLVADVPRSCRWTS